MIKLSINKCNRKKNEQSQNMTNGQAETALPRGLLYALSCFMDWTLSHREVTAGSTVWTTASDP